MKCVCGYEKVGTQPVEVPAQSILHTRGKNKGKVKEYIPAHTEWVDSDPQNPEFIVIGVERDFEFTKEVNHHYNGTLKIPVEILACPKCGTLKLHDSYLED